MSGPPADRSRQTGRSGGPVRVAAKLSHYCTDPYAVFFFSPMSGIDYRSCIITTSTCKVIHLVSSRAGPGNMRNTDLQARFSPAACRRFLSNAVHIAHLYIPHVHVCIVVRSKASVVRLVIVRLEDGRTKKGMISERFAGNKDPACWEWRSPKQEFWWWPRRFQSRNGLPLSGGEDAVG